MGGSCSTVSFETRMANQLLKTKGSPSREAPPRPPHAGNEKPNMAVTSLGDSKRAEGNRRRVWEANILREGDTGPFGDNASPERSCSEETRLGGVDGGCSSSPAPEWSLPTICFKSQEERAPGERAVCREHAPRQSGVNASDGSGLSVPKQRRASIHGAPHQQEVRSRYAADQKAPQHLGRRLLSDPPTKTVKERRVFISPGRPEGVAEEHRSEGGGLGCSGRRRSVVW